MPASTNTTARESGPTGRIGAMAARHARLVMWVWAVLIAASAVLLPLQLGRLSIPSTAMGDSPALRAAELITRGFPRLGSEQMMLAFDSPRWRGTDPAYQKAVSSTARALVDRAGVGTVLPVPTVTGQNSHHVYVSIGVTGDESVRRRRLPHLQDVAYRTAREASGGRVTVAVVGLTPVLAELIHADVKDLRFVEIVTVPTAVLLLAFGLGSLGAAVVPLVVAVSTILVSTGALMAMSLVTQVDTTMLTLASSVGLGLGLDYALLILLRYRQVRARGHSPLEATARATATAGTTVSWCALVVVTTSAALLIIPARNVRMLALGAMIATGITLCAALTLLPALLPRLDAWLDRGRLRRRNGLPGKTGTQGTAGPPENHGTGAKTGTDGWWTRWTLHLMRRPWPYLLSALTVLVLAATPVLGIRLGLHYDRTALAHTTTGQGLLRMEHDRLASVTVLALPHPPGFPPVDTTTLATALHADPRVALASALDNGKDLTVLAVGERNAPDSTASTSLLNDIHRLAPRLLPAGQRVLVAGPTAALADLKSAAVTGLWQVIGIVLAASFVLLLIVFRSVLIPLKAIAMNVLAVGAAFGVLTLVSEGTPTGGGVAGGGVNVLIPLLAFALVFGLSMDYEVFLVHRIAEHYHRSGDNARAVAHGLQHTARTITLAAAVMVVTFAGLLTTHRQDFQQMGLTVAAAIAIDVTLIRIVLVPSLMRLLGHRNWWLPHGLTRLLPAPRRTEAHAFPDSEASPLVSPRANHTSRTGALTEEQG
ncbi:MMPL family transporter [Streptomyces roseoverticillatus]|uniref:MMPL family transporter n=1 Tax=Streptomyces roseoverticillatus TaxID=66429 RepID=UPI001F2B5255|nr:MMPL family transporter [Streptomyces roseoverticillatus]MCF3103236.1 MMPL family transporter [Streptomyces roseoverticillatus]